MPLTDTQVTQLRAKVIADPAGLLLLRAGNVSGLNSWLNGASTFIGWKTSISLADVGDAMNASEVVGLTAIKLQALQVISAYSNGYINPSRQDRRDAFTQVFNGAGGNVTRPAIDAAFKRAATNAERLLATGTGTSVAPGALTFEGDVSFVETTGIIYKDDGSIWPN